MHFAPSPIFRVKLVLQLEAVAATLIVDGRNRRPGGLVGTGMRLGSDRFRWFGAWNIWKAQQRPHVEADCTCCLMAGIAPTINAGAMPA
jgi:hypothetical protein